MWFPTLTVTLWGARVLTRVRSPLFDIGNIQALAVYNLVFTAPYLRALAGGARRSNYTKWQNKSGAKAIWRQTIKSGA